MREEQKRADYYLNISRTLQEASIKMGLRSALGYVFTPEERKALADIQEIFFPGQALSGDAPHAVLGRASGILTDAWAGVPVAYLPPVSELRIAENAAKQLRNQPVHFGERRSK
ncbi:MAG: hypothetical protein V8T29_00625 [Oscillospiraceae bacterium]